MTKVVWLRLGEQPPEGVRRALVDVDRSRGNNGWLIDRSIDGDGQTFYVVGPYGKTERDVALAAAKDWAEGEQVDVYVSARAGVA